MRATRNSLALRGALAAITFGISLPLDPLRTNLGLYLYGSQAGVMDIINCKYFAEGPTSSVAVITYGENVSLRVNGKVDAGDLSDMSTQLGLACFPRIFCPAAPDVLVVGFGSGTTSGTSLLFPGTQVTSCEIEPAVVGAESFFQHVNHRPLARQRRISNGRTSRSPRAPAQSRAARRRIVVGHGVRRRAQPVAGG